MISERSFPIFQPEYLDPIHCHLQINQLMKVMNQRVSDFRNLRIPGIQWIPQSIRSISPPLKHFLAPKPLIPAVLPRKVLPHFRFIAVYMG